MTETETAQPSRAGIRSKFAFATLIVVGLASTVSQFIAAEALGIIEHLEWSFSAGGLLAIIGAIHMAVVCHSWAFWRKWVWVWVCATALPAFLGVNLASQSLIRDVESPYDTEIVVSEECLALHAQLEALARQIDEDAQLGPGDPFYSLVQANRRSHPDGRTTSEHEYDDLQTQYSASC